MKKISVILIGCSAGGVSALQILFSRLPKKFALPIIVVQHLPPTASINPALVFGSFFHGQLVEAMDKMPLKPGFIFFAPPDYHLLLEKDFTLGLSQDEPVHFSRPSIDALFESAAFNIGAEVCAVLLTGANEDGAQGLKLVHEHGGYSIVQDLQEAEFKTMPKSALDLFKPDQILSLKEISEQLAQFSEGQYEKS